MQKFKRTAAFLTAVAMTFSLFPTAVLASNEQDLEAGSLTEDYIYSEGLYPQYLTEAEELVGTDVLVGGYEASGYSEDYYITQTTPSVPTTNTFTVDGITYQMLLSDNYIPTNRVQVLRCNKGKTGEVVVPDTVENNGATYEVISVGFASFLKCDSITSVTLPSSVKSIGDFAFQDCTNLKSINLSNGLESMGEQIFYNCGSLESVEIPDSVTSMGFAMFAECSGLKNVKLPKNDKLMEIPANTFQGCSSLTSIGSVDSGASVEIPENITSIGDSAFIYSGLDGKITIPDGITTIGKAAFAYCAVIEDSNEDVIVKSGITEIVIPDSVTTIGNMAFIDCAALKNAEIPDSVQTIGSGVFTNCTVLTDVILPSGLGTLGDYTFQNCHSLKSIDLPDNLTYIGEGAFLNSGLTSIILPDSLITISSKAFFNCKNLANISLSNKLQYIGDYAFTFAGLTDIDFPNSVIAIGYGAFESCESLESVAMPTGTNDNLEQIGGERLFGDRVFSGCTDLKQVDLSDTYITAISSDAFSGCISLEEIVIPDTVTIICSSAFNNCYSLTEIELPNNLKAIGLCAFYGCKGLTQITIPANVMYIGYGAFYDCTNLKDVTVQNENPPILEEDENNNCDIFTNCSSELEIHIPVGTKATYNETQWANYNLKGSCYISGTVTDELGNPIPNVAVTICDETENEMVTEYTDSNGQYTTYNMALEDGNYIFKFSKEGYTEKTEAITADGVNIEDANFVLSEYKIYTVTEGAGSAYEKGSAEGLKFVCDADYTKFKEITVDGTVVDNSNYTTESGSTIITFKSSYLETLSVGTHTLRINYEDGYAETNFTINEASTNYPSTDGNETGGDTTNEDSSTNNDATNNNSTTNSNANGGSNLSTTNETPKTGDNPFLTVSFALVGISFISLVAFKRNRRVKSK